MIYGLFTGTTLIPSRYACLICKHPTGKPVSTPPRARKMAAATLVLSINRGVPNSLGVCHRSSLTGRPTCLSHHLLAAASFVFLVANIVTRVFTSSLGTPIPMHTGVIPLNAISTCRQPTTRAAARPTIFGESLETMRRVYGHHKLTVRDLRARAIASFGILCGAFSYRRCNNGGGSSDGNLSRRRRALDISSGR